MPETGVRRNGVSEHLLHPPLTRTASSSRACAAKMMADPEQVGRALARRIGSKVHHLPRARQRLMVGLAYHLPGRIGRLMSRMTRRAQENNKSAAAVPVTQRRTKTKPRAAKVEQCRSADM